MFFFLLFLKMHNYACNYGMKTAKASFFLYDLLLNVGIFRHLSAPFHRNCMQIGYCDWMHCEICRCIKIDLLFLSDDFHASFPSLVEINKINVNCSFIMPNANHEK